MVEYEKARVQVVETRDSHKKAKVRFRRAMRERLEEVIRNWLETDWIDGVRPEPPLNEEVERRASDVVNNIRDLKSAS